MIFDPRFLFSLLLTARWFVRACMLEDDSTTNNHAHLLLYGGSGTGKTLIVSAIASSVPTYKFLTNSRFQNPDMLRSSLLSIEEFDTSQLPSNQYKQLLDLKTHVKVDFKNLNPENVTEGVPCMITTNDEVLSVLKQQKKYNQSSVAAALRRLYIVPMKAGSFEKLHGRIPKSSPFHNKLMHLDPRFDKEPNKLQRIFNLIVAFALFQQDVHGLYFDSRLHPYFQKLVKDFTNTAFGTFYLSQKEKVDEIIGEVEHVMMQQDSDDSGYLVKVSTCVGQFQQLQYQFLADMTANNPEIDKAVIKDKTVPWPIKAYYLLSSLKFNIKLMWQVERAETFLNPEVSAFLNNPNMQLFRATEVFAQDEIETEYNDLRDPFDSVDEANDPFERQSFGAPEVREDKLVEIDIDSMIDGMGKRTFSQQFGVDSEMNIIE